MDSKVLVGGTPAPMAAVTVSGSALTARRAEVVDVAAVDRLEVVVTCLCRHVEYAKWRYHRPGPRLHRRWSKLRC